MKRSQSKVKMERKEDCWLHRNLFLPCEAILEEPEGFHLKKEKQKKPKQ